MTRLLLVSLIIISLAGCATSPKGRKQLMFVPDDLVNSMGVQAFQEMKAQEPVDRQPAVNAYVKCVADAITAVAGDGSQGSWEVVVFQDDTANAFALPGKKIGVHTGLLKVAQTPAQLAAVIGHEVGHVLAKHGGERMSENFATQGGLAVLQATFQNKGPKYDLIMASLGLGAQFGILLPHSRDQESEADLIGLDLMAKAGFDPQESVQLWQNMEKAGGGQPPEFLSTHPSHGTRMGNLKANMGNAVKLYQGSGRHPSCRPS
jgi:predicted Zn-dependent protease